MKVTQTSIYPLKSAAGISADIINIENKGPLYDREWMLVFADGPKAGHFITQRDRNSEKLALVHPKVDVNGTISFSASGFPDIEVPSQNYISSKNKVTVWNDECDALDAGQEAADWFSDYVGVQCRLVKMPDEFKRQTNLKYSEQGDSVRFADQFPLLITNEASLQSLSTHFPSGTNVTMDNFRPNIVISGGEPFIEDVMYQVKIGDLIVEFAKPCNRCKIVTIDQSTGLAVGKEPLASLAKTRNGKADDGLRGVFFGQHAIPRQTGVIQVGDTVEILSQRPMHPALDSAQLKYEF